MTQEEKEEVRYGAHEELIAKRYSVPKAQLVEFLRGLSKVKQLNREELAALGEAYLRESRVRRCRKPLPSWKDRLMGTALRVMNEESRQVFVYGRVVQPGAIDCTWERQPQGVLPTPNHRT